MLKIKNKFITFIILLLILILSYGIYSGYIVKNINRESYVVLINGEAVINDIQLIVDEREKLSVGDSIKTTGNDSLAVLEWGDGSVTRLGGNTSIKIEELDISNDLGKINIGFELFNGKTWSNVISFFGEGSHFKEYFRDSEAATRGTIFNVDLDNNYLNVIDHKVELLNSDGTNITIDSKNALNLKTFTFIEIQEFITKFKDKSWEALNYKIDLEFIRSIRNQIATDVSRVVDLGKIDINKILLDQAEREKLYNELLTNYQKYNSIKPEDIELFKTKIDIKEILIKLADDENKVKLVKNTLYDFQDTINSKEYSSLDKQLSILNENKSLIPNVDLKGLIPDVDLKQFIDDSGVPEGLKDEFINNFNLIRNILGK